MTRVAHRVAALEEQQFLIIHATADGETQGQTHCKSGGTSSMVVRVLTNTFLFFFF